MMLRLGNQLLRLNADLSSAGIVAPINVIFTSTRKQSKDISSARKTCLHDIHVQNNGQQSCLN